MSQYLSREFKYLDPWFNRKIVSLEPIKILASLNHFKPETQKTLDMLAPATVLRAGGAGNKCMRIALG